jgi:hypothetical protein
MGGTFIISQHFVKIYTVYLKIQEEYHPLCCYVRTIVSSTVGVTVVVFVSPMPVFCRLRNVFIVPINIPI